MDDKYEGLEEMDRDQAMCADGWKKPKAKTKSVPKKEKSDK